MEKKTMPLSIMIEHANGMLTDAFNQIQQQTTLPAYLLEGAVLGLLAQVRKQKNMELISDHNRMMEHQGQDQKKEGENDGEH